MSVDTGTINITRQDAAGLDADIYYVNLEQTFVLHRPLPDWDYLEELTIQQQLSEDNVTCQVLCDQPVFRIRYGKPIEVESDRQTTVNGNPIPDNILNISETLYGPPPWKFPYYSQMVLNVFYKSEVQEFGIHTLPDIILLMTRFSGGRVNKIVAQEGSHFAIVQLSSNYAGIRLDGQSTTMTIDGWMLFAETDNAFYTIEISYTPQSGQPIQVWDDLQTYIDQFRVIQ